MKNSTERLEDQMEGILFFSPERKAKDKEMGNRKDRTIRGPVKEVQYPNNRSSREINRENHGGNPQLNSSR